MAISTRPIAASALSGAAGQHPSATPSWPWHTLLVGSVRAALLMGAQRRMEAESYLADGYGVRLAIEAKPAGWMRFSEIAVASMPSRIKQILVAPKHGVPYLNTSQVFDLRPMPRKWLAMEKTIKGEARLVAEGAILVMRSATVGRAIVATKVHENAIISDHFMRVTPLRSDLAGWTYAYLRSPQAMSMMSGSQYASVIRHIEPHHLAMLPVPVVSKDVARDFEKLVTEIVACRNDAARLRDEAEEAFAKAIGPVKTTEREEGFTVRLSAVTVGRRRLEAAYHSPAARAVVSRFKKWEALGEITDGVWWGKRFKRHYGDGGVLYMSADDVFTMNPYSTTRILVDAGDGHENFFVQRGWLIMACSGQVYGLNGATTIASEWHENTFFSHDMIRIRPKEGARAGYLLTALTHPALGRPLLIREAYGMSIPHLDPEDVAAFPVARLGRATEDVIADLAEKAASQQARAEVLERELAEAAGKVISDFLMGPSIEVGLSDQSSSKNIKKKAQSGGSATLSLLSDDDLAGSKVRHLTSIQAAGRAYRLSPPISYALSQEGEFFRAEAKEFDLCVAAEGQKEASEELCRHLAALIEGYALEDDSRLAKSGKKLKQLLLARISLM